VKSTSALFGYAKSTEVAHTRVARIGPRPASPSGGQAPS
jgi:hypothetical protein